MQAGEVAEKRFFVFALALKGKFPDAEARRIGVHRPGMIAYLRPAAFEQLSQIFPSQMGIVGVVVVARSKGKFRKGADDVEEGAGVVFFQQRQGVKEVVVMSVVEREDERFFGQLASARRVCRDLTGQDEGISRGAKVFQILFKAGRGDDIFPLPAFEYAVVHRADDDARILARILFRRRTRQGEREKESDEQEG